MLRELNAEEMGMVSGGIVGSMYDKDAHNGPGGLWGPGGQLEQEYQQFDGMTQSTYGVDGMTYLAMSATEQGRAQLDFLANPDACEDMLNEAATITGAVVAIFGGAAAVLSVAPHPYAQGAARVLGASAGIMGAGTGAAILHGCEP
jgi:hypothetical protein